MNSLPDLRLANPQLLYTPADGFWTGYCGETPQGKDYLRSQAEFMPYRYSDSLPPRIDPRLNPKFAQGWLRTENQGGVGACWIEGQMLTLFDGTRKPIEEVTLHDRVLSHSGQPRRVNELFRRKYTGSIYHFKIEGHAEIVSVTDNHKFMRHVGEGQFEEQRADALQVGDLVYLSKVCSAGDSRSTIDLVDHLPEGCPVGIDWVRGGVRSKKMPRYLALDEKLGWLLGFYAAEGYVIHSARKVGRGQSLRVQFAFHRQEKKLQQRVRNYMRDLFGVEMGEIAEKSRPNNYYLYTDSRTLGLALEQLMGKGAGNKRVPTEILAASNECRLAFLRGWLAGDGSSRFTRIGEKLPGGTLSKNNYVRVVGYTTSLEMGEALTRIALSLGLSPHSTLQPAREGNRKPQWIINFRAHDVLTLCDPDDVPDWVSPYLQSRNNAATASNRCGVATVKQTRQEITPALVAAKIVDIRVEPVVDLQVYNLEADVEHTVVVNGVATFQCQGYALSENVEYNWAVLTGEVVQLSPMFAYLMSQYFDGINGDRGSTLSGGTKLLTQYGLPLLTDYSVERSYPRGGYRAIPQGVIDKAKAAKFKLHKTVRFRDASEYRAFVGSYAGIVQTGTRWTGSMARIPSHGVVTSIGGASMGGHSWNFVGYMPIDELSQAARAALPRTSSEFVNIAKNSHSTGYGDKGFSYYTDELFNQLNKSDLLLGRTDMGDVKPRPSKIDFTNPKNSRFNRVQDR